MGTTISHSAENVTITIAGTLGYASWQAMRDARNAALERRLPLQIDIAHCRNADLAGIGAILIAQDALGTVGFCGCHDEFPTWLAQLGVCERCSASPAGCPRRNS